MTPTSAVRTLQLTVLAVLAGAVMTGCGSSMSTTGPSSTSLSGSGAVISGRVNLTGGAAASVASTPATPERAPDTASAFANGSGGLTVTVIGTGMSTTIDSGGTFTLNNVPAGTVQLHFQGRGADAMLTISGIAADDRLQIAVTLNGRDARLDSQQRMSGGNGVDVNGRIDSINTVARTLQVAGNTVIVQPSTTIRHGARSFSFADLRVGDHVIVKGSRNGVNVTATEIKVNRGGGEDDDDDDGDNDNESEVRGTVSLLIGTCPGLTFTVAGTRVVTNAATRFEGGTCSTLRNEMFVEVEGIRRSDGSLLATQVNRLDNGSDDNETEVRGTVSLLTGTCPGLTFTVAGTRVVTNAVTRFEEGTCSALRNEMRVEVEGIRRNDGSLLATEVERES